MYLLRNKICLGSKPASSGFSFGYVPLDQLLSHQLLSHLHPLPQVHQQHQAQQRHQPKKTKNMFHQLPKQKNLMMPKTPFIKRNQKYFISKMETTKKSVIFAKLRHYYYYVNNYVIDIIKCIQVLDCYS